MNRYRSYGQLDDPPIDEGDNSLVGVNSYDTPENLKPGECQAATNMDFTSQDARTRGGFVCLPELGTLSFGNVWSGKQGSTIATWTALGYGNGTFVALAPDPSTDTMYSMDNGVTWKTGSSSVASIWSSVCYGNSIFVAVSASVTANGVMTSSDGITWTTRTSAAVNTWNSVCFGAGIFTAVGYGAVMTSPDGITWTLRTTGVPNKNWASITFAIGLFVAVTTESGSTANVITSPDGINWTAQVGANTNGWRSIVYGQSVFVAVSNSGAGVRAMTSQDAVTWTERPSAANLDWTGVAFGSGGFVAVANTGSTQQVMASPNGFNWALQSTAYSSKNWQTVIYGNGIFMAVNANGGSLDAIMTCSDPFLSTFASGSYSDPNSTETPWIVLAGSNSAGFFSFGQTSRTISYPTGYTITQQSTIVQANNYLFIFSGPDQVPLRWDGTWGGSFVTAPASTLGVGYEDIPQSNSATYYQNRLWVIQGKDTIAASQNLDFQNFNVLSSVFNLNVGTSDYLLCSYPFANNALVVFKNRSSYLLQAVDGALTDVTSTEITRQLGIIGINAVTAVGPDLIYMSSDRNITSVRLNLQNATQAVTVPISRNINPIMRRVNWTYGYKVALGYWNNLLFVALPLDQSTVCNTILVYNFVTNQWYGEWTFADSIAMNVQGFVTANYLGQIRMHAITEDGRIFVVDEGQNDISGTTVADIATSLTTRAYMMDNNNRFTRRLYIDLSTNRPDYSITAYVDGANEYSQEVTNQTYTRSQSWIYNDTAYDLTNANNDYNRAFRKDYSTGPDSVECGTGFLPEMLQDFREPVITRRNGRLQWMKVTNATGYISINGVGFEARSGYRSNLIQV